MILREKDRDALLRIFATVSMPIEIWAYGSRVNGDAHDGSDLDLVVRGSNLAPLPIAVLEDLTEQIKDSNIPILVELRDWARLPASFHKNIERRHEVMYRSPQAALLP